MTSLSSFRSNMKRRVSFKRWRMAAIVFFILWILAALPTISSVDSGPDYVGSIRIEGMILGNDDVISTLREIQRSTTAKALIVHVNSPGGSLAASETLYYTLRDIAKTRPVAVVIEDVAASGGYMTALAGDYIVARNGSITGSIGVIMQSFDVTELARKVGVNLTSLKSAKLKGDPSPFEVLSDEGRAWLDVVLSEGHHIFSQLVKERRALTDEKVATIADGRIFLGRQALKRDLIDAIGGEKEALAWVYSQSEIDSALPIRKLELLPPASFMETLLSSKATAAGLMQAMSPYKAIMAVLESKI